MMTPRKIVRLISGKAMSSRSDEDSDDDSEGRENIGSMSSSKHHEDYFVVSRPRERLKSSRGKQFDMLVNELSHESTQRQFSREGFFAGIADLYHGFVIHPESNRMRGQMVHEK